MQGQLWAWKLLRVSNPGSLSDITPFLVCWCFVQALHFLRIFQATNYQSKFVVLECATPSRFFLFSTAIFLACVPARLSALTHVQCQRFSWTRLLEKNLGTGWGRGECVNETAGGTPSPPLFSAPLSPPSSFHWLQHHVIRKPVLFPFPLPTTGKHCV